eukprot:6726071-Prymnesium_polylepis.1
MRGAARSSHTRGRGDMLWRAVARARAARVAQRTRKLTSRLPCDPLCPFATRALLPLAPLGAQSMGGMGGMGGMGEQPMNNKEKKKLQKAQAEAAKKKQKEYEARQKALKAAQKKRAAASRSRGAVSERKGPLSMLFSFKGLALTGITGFLYVSQRELLTSIIGLVLKYPILLGSWCAHRAAHAHRAAAHSLLWAPPETHAP